MSSVGPSVVLYLPHALLLGLLFVQLGLFVASWQANRDTRRRQYETFAAPPRPLVLTCELRDDGNQDREGPGGSP